MNLPRRTVVHALLALAIVGAAGLDARAQGADSPERMLALWLDALERRDYAGYRECLHSGARETSQYGSPEAMDFWADEIGDLTRKGFAGQFRIEAVGDEGDRFPPGALRAYPIVNGRSIGAAIVLIQEAGHWTILRLFS